MSKRRVFKEKFTNKILQDCNGEEVEFPKVADNDTPEVGDEVLIDGKKETGERLMPNGSLIKFKEGKVTHIIPEPEDAQNVKTTTAMKDNVCRTLKSSTGQKIEVVGSNAKTAFSKGNRVLVDGKKMAMARCEISGKQMTIINGRIASVYPISQPKNRRVFKPEGKKMIGTPVKPKGKKMIGVRVNSEEPKQHKATAEKKSKLLQNEKMVFMKSIKKSNH